MMIQKRERWRMAALEFKCFYNVAMQRCSVEECPPGNYEVGRGWSCYRREARESPEEYLLEGDDAEWGNNGALRTYPSIYVHDP